MKRIPQVVMIASLAFAVASAWSGEGHVPPENDPRDSAESYLNVAAIGSQTAARDMAVEAAPERKRAGMLEDLGIAGHGPFPSSGGPLDGGGD